jgi:virulence-associated protein VagC
MPTLAKKTSKNQLTLPKAVVARFPGVDYFEVSAEGDRIVLKPVRVGGADEVRERLAVAGIDLSDVSDAVAWARRRRR